MGKEWPRPEESTRDTLATRAEVVLRHGWRHRTEGRKNLGPAKKAIDQLDDVDDVEREFGIEPEQDTEILLRIEEQPQAGSANTEALIRILHDERTNDYEEVWRQFRLLDRESQLSLAVSVFDYLSTFDRLPDARRMIQLFKDFRNTASEDRFRIFLRAYLILGDFKGVLDEHWTWDLTYEVWGTVKSFTETHPEHKFNEFEQWSYLQEVPDTT